MAFKLEAVILLSLVGSFDCSLVYVSTLVGMYSLISFSSSPWIYGVFHQVDLKSWVLIPYLKKLLITEKHPSDQYVISCS